MTEAQLKAIAEGIVEGLAPTISRVLNILEDVTPRLIAVEDRLGGVEIRLTAVETEVGKLRSDMERGFGELTSAMLILADNFPGSMSGERSHIRKRVEQALAGRVHLEPPTEGRP